METLPAERGTRAARTVRSATTLLLLLNLWLDLEFIVMAQYYFVQSNLSLIIIFLITYYHLIAFTDSKVAERTRSKEKHVESLLHELVASAPDYDSTLVV